ncbi:hypothetical protein NPIL_526471 [Nephila pilipes]|uniref:Uncharacterized protein n=1 Tax=Nephila pilipes TaxID=299642 RepID=A0A8X6NN09_NEPPI|nr:hypothetical protein NPIL_253221 [Nephila pilipes]GFU41778.1 hypothetical protein NPIL_526471 [Nephila pilipes]
MSSPDNAPKYWSYFLQKLALLLLKPHSQQRRLIPSLSRSSKNIMKSQFNEFEAASPQKRKDVVTCGRKKITPQPNVQTECSNFVF